MSFAAVLKKETSSANKNSDCPLSYRAYDTLMYFTYILRCSDDSLYVGSTNDLERRVAQHNTSKSGAHYTKIRRPVELVYHESFSTLRDARHREAELKRWKRDKKIALLREAV